MVLAGATRTKQRRGLERRRYILDFVAEYQHHNGYAPSVREISQEVGTVPSNVHHHLRVLEEEGVIARTPGIARSYTINR